MGGEAFVVSLMAQNCDSIPKTSQPLTSYSVPRIFDVLAIGGTVGLLLCYAWARHLGHVGVFCDISDLVIHLPERILFRLNFGLVGAMLAMCAFPIHDVAASRVGGILPKIGALFQLISGVGVILVGGCGPTEIQWFHVVAAAMGFAASGIAQIIYTAVFLTEDQSTQPKSAKMIFWVRCGISVSFFSSFVIYLLGQLRYLPEPTEHIFEWAMWFTLLGWYFTFKWDLADFYVVSMRRDSAPGANLLLREERHTYS